MPGRDGTGPTGTGPMTGRGLGLSCRRGLGSGFGRAFAVNQSSTKTQKELLQEQKNILQNRLETIERQLGGL